jgi:ribonucleoside-diphosphate reductase subunit M1
MNKNMRVQKRNGVYEDVSFDKILNRIKLLCIGEEFNKKLNIDPTIIAQKVCSEIYNDVKTSDLDKLSSEISIALYTTHPDYALLSSRICISNHQKGCPDKFSNSIDILYNNYVNSEHHPIIHRYLYDLVMYNKDLIDSKINQLNDYKLDFFGFKTLEKSYLLKKNKIIIETPQYLFMRVALCIHRDNLDKAFETYNMISNKYFIHATPTLFNSGTNNEQLASCFLLAMKDDSISGIFDTLKDCALISKHAGGIGLHCHNIRAAGSMIKGTNGISNGLVPMLRVFNDTARYVDQGGGKRNGSIAIYLEPWHADIMEFLELKKNHGNELEKARDLFYGLWIPDLFMKRVQENGNWTLMCPNECPGLADCYGEDFEKLYTKYEQEGRGKTIEAQKVWHSIYISQIEVGMPYILFKDACNKKSNQNNLGTIKSSNLCTEIIEYSDKDETAVCNLASISLTNLVEGKNITDNITIYSKSNCPQCDYIKNIMDSRDINYTEIKLDNKSDRIKLYQKIDSEEDILVEIMPQIYVNDNYLGGFLELYDYIKPEFNYDKLEEIAGILTLNLNNIIDNNYYPLEETKRSNFRHRPIGIGVQGLANVFYEMGVSFDSKEAKEINEKIFEHVYYGSLKKSMEIAKEREELFIKLKSYMRETDGLRFPEEYYTLKDEIGCTQEELDKLFNNDKYYGTYLTFEGSPASKGLLQFDLWDKEPSKDMLYKWNELKDNIVKYGLRNSLCVAPMPTASTSQILGNYECFEPVMSNIYTRRVLAGEYVVINNYLINDLIHYGIWNKELKDKIIVNDGSIQTIDIIPTFIKDRYKTGWEIKQKNIIDMSVDRGKYICQSQSLNLFIEAPTFKTISSMHFYSWKKGLKTGIYYLRSRPSSKAIQFTVDPEICENCSG